MSIALIVIAAIIVIAVAASYLTPGPIAALALAAERRRCGLRTCRTTIPGYGIAYLDGGRDDDRREVLVLIHGIGADKDHFTRSAGVLRQRFRVIALDLPGFGDSDKPADGRYAIRDQVEHVYRFLQQLRLSTVHLGGNSMGGWIAAQFAATHADLVQSLWLLAPAGVEGAQDSDMMRRVEAGDPPPLFARTPAEFDAVLAYVVSKKPFVPGVLRRALARQAALNYALHTRIFNLLRDDPEPLEPVAHRITAPTLVVWGAEDRVLDPRGAPILAQAISGAEYIVMPGIGHLPMMESVNGTARDYLEFVARRCAH